MAKTEPKHAGGLGGVARVFAFTFLSTLLSFALVLLVSILGTILYAEMKHAAPNLVFAYKRIALPAAVGVGAVVLVASLMMEVRNYRQGKVLAAIERSTNESFSH